MAAYLIGRIRVDDPDTYARYAARTPDVIAQHGGRFLVRGGAVEPLEGPNTRSTRTVVIEFPDMERAKTFYQSPEYQEIAKLRWQAADGELFIVEGVTP